MPIVTWDHVHLRSPDPEATAAWLENILGGVIIRGPGRIDVKLGGANVFIAPVAAGDGVNAPPKTPYQGLRWPPRSRLRAWSSRRSRRPFGRESASASSAARRASRSSCSSATRNMHKKNGAPVVLLRPLRSSITTL